MARLTTKQRKRLSKKSFAIPGKRAYPINDKSHARNALLSSSSHSTLVQIHYNEAWRATLEQITAAKAARGIS